MSCKTQVNNSKCNFNIKNFGTYDLSRIKIDGKDRTQLNWSEISVPEILTIPEVKPDIEHLNQVYANTNITCVKLIETPFAYQVYERLATTFEITSAGAAINLAAAIDITAVQAAVAAILSIPALPVIPQVAALQAALNAVNTAFASLTTAIAQANIVINGTCVLAAALVAALEAVNVALEILQNTLNALIVTANALALATAAIPIVGPAVAAAVAALITAINVVITDILDTITAILDVITLIGYTKYFAIISNEEGTCLSGRKLVIQGVLSQKVVYTGLVTTQSVHSASFEVPFSAFVIPYAKFEGLEYEENVEVLVPGTTTCETTTINGFAYNPNEPIVVDLCEEFCVDALIEDIFAYALNPRTVFKNVTLFLQAKVSKTC